MILAPFACWPNALGFWQLYSGFWRYIRYVCLLMTRSHVVLGCHVCAWFASLGSASVFMLVCKVVLGLHCCARFGRLFVLGLCGCAGFAWWCFPHMVSHSCTPGRTFGYLFVCAWAVALVALVLSRHPGPFVKRQAIAFLQQMPTMCWQHALQSFVRTPSEAHSSVALVMHPVIAP
jgi:hypothetical protein